MLDIPTFTDPEGGSCFSIYQIRRIKERLFYFFFWNFRETTRHFSLRSQNSEYPRMFQVTGANQNALKLLSTDLVNTNNHYCHHHEYCYSQKAIIHSTTSLHKHFHSFSLLFFKGEREGQRCCPFFNTVRFRRTSHLSDASCLNKVFWTPVMFSLRTSIFKKQLVK